MPQSTKLSTNSQGRGDWTVVRSTRRTPKVQVHPSLRPLLGPDKPLLRFTEKWSLEGTLKYARTLSRAFSDLDRLVRFDKESTKSIPKKVKPQAVLVGSWRKNLESIERARRQTAAKLADTPSHDRRFLERHLAHLKTNVRSLQSNLREVRAAGLSTVKETVSGSPEKKRSPSYLRRLGRRKLARVNRETVKSSQASSGADALVRSVAKAVFANSTTFSMPFPDPSSLTSDRVVSGLLTLRFSRGKVTSKKIAVDARCDGVEKPFRLGIAEAHPRFDGVFVLPSADVPQDLFLPALLGLMIGLSHEHTEGLR